MLGRLGPHQCCWQYSVSLGPGSHSEHQRPHAAVWRMRGNLKVRASNGSTQQVGQGSAAAIPSANGSPLKGAGGSAERAQSGTKASTPRSSAASQSQPQQLRSVTKQLPRVLVMHTGGTLGMDPSASFEATPKGTRSLRPGTGGVYAGAPPHVCQPDCCAHAAA